MKYLSIVLTLLLLLNMPMSKDERNAKRRAKYAQKVLDKRAAAMDTAKEGTTETSFEDEWKRREGNRKKSKASRSRLTALRSKKRCVGL